MVLWRRRCSARIPRRGTSRSLLALPTRCRNPRAKRAEGRKRPWRKPCTIPAGAPCCNTCLLPGSRSHPCAVARAFAPFCSLRVALLPAHVAAQGQTTPERFLCCSPRRHCCSSRWLAIAAFLSRRAFSARARLRLHSAATSFHAVWHFILRDGTLAAYRFAMPRRERATWERDDRRLARWLESALPAGDTRKQRSRAAFALYAATTTDSISCSLTARGTGGSHRSAQHRLRTRSGNPALPRPTRLL